MLTQLLTMESENDLELKDLPFLEREERLRRIEFLVHKMWSETGEEDR